MSDRDAPAPGPLAGVRVLDVTVNVLGPQATQILGDMGADVIKIETPAGDPMRLLGPSRGPGMGSHFLAFNRNKRSVVLDLKRPAALEALLRLAGGADVFVHTMRLPAAERLGIGYPVLAARNPRLVYAAATGYRKDGPRRDRPAFDDVIQGESGLGAMLGRTGGVPHYVPMAMADKFCGILLASAIGMALFHRERTGRGQEVHVPMFESMVAFNMADHMWEGTFGEPERGLGYPRMFTPHRRPYRTKDGHIGLLAVTDAQWARLFEAIGRPDLAGDARFATMGGRTEHIDLLYGILGETIATRSTAEWQQRLDAADVPNGPMNTLETLYDDPYLRGTGFFRETTDAQGTRVTAPGIPVDFQDSPGDVRLPPPVLGQHTREVLAELGYGEAELQAVTEGGGG